MLGLRVRGRGGRDRTAPVAAPKSAFLWGSTPFLFARAKKWGGTGRAGAVYCLIKRRTRNRARQGGLVIVLSACALLLWAVVVGLSCDSTPFLWCLPKETVSSRQRKALFYPGGSTIRVSATALWTGRSSPDFGEGLVLVGGLYVCAVTLGGVLWPLLPIPPHFFALAQRNGVEPQRNALKGAATGAVGSCPPLPRTRSPNITADCVKLT